MARVVDGGGLAGTVAAGRVRVGDRVGVHPAGVEGSVARIVAGDDGRDRANDGDEVTLFLAGDVTAAAGDLVASSADPPGAGTQFEVTIVWTADEPMLRGRSYLLRAGARTTVATVAPLKYRFDLETKERLPAARLERGEAGVCQIALEEPIAFDPYTANRRTGSFVLADRATGRQLGGGLIHFELRRSGNVRWQVLDVDKRARSEQNAQTPCVLWFTGLSGAGKSTIANLVERRLHALGRRTYLLDGDNVRHRLNKDLGFTEADRVENIRRVAEVARLMVDAGLIVVVAFISPFASERRMARGLFEVGEFVEVFVDTPLDVAEARDPKGLYAKARRGELVNFTGIDSPYEPPLSPEVHVDTTVLVPDAAAERIVGAVLARQ